MNINFLDPNPSGEPIVLLLHGLGATGISWSMQFDALVNAGYRPIAPDVPGFGNSVYDGKGWTIERMAAEFATLLKSIGNQPAHIVGLSMGGVITQQLAYQYPHLVRKLVLVSTFSVFQPESLSAWLYFFRRALAVTFSDMDTQARIVAQRIFPNEEQDFLRDALVNTINTADRRAYRSAMFSLGTFDSRKWLKKLTFPTLIVTGSEDTTIPSRRQKQLKEMIPGALQVIIEGANHATPIDHAPQFNQALLNFLGAP